MPRTAVSRSYQCRTRLLSRVNAHHAPSSSSIKIATSEAAILRQVSSKAAAYACDVSRGTDYELSGTSISDGVAYPAT